MQSWRIWNNKETWIKGTDGLHIRRAVAEYLGNPDDHYKPSDVIRSLSGEAWIKLYLSQATVLELVKSNETEMKRGTAAEAEHLINLFDKSRPEKAVLVAPHLRDGVHVWTVISLKSERSSMRKSSLSVLTADQHIPGQIRRSGPQGMDLFYGFRLYIYKCGSYSKETGNLKLPNVRPIQEDPEDIKRSRFFAVL